MTASSPRHGRNRDKDTLSIYERALWSSLGALAPIILSLLDIDFNALISSLSVGALLGTVAQIAVYIFSATIVVHFYQDEHSKSKLFHLGLAAPAFLAALIGQTGPTLNVAVIPPSHTSLPFVSLAQAQPGLAGLCQTALREGFDVKTVAPDEPGFVEQFVRGFTRQKPRGEHYVVVDSFASAEQADRARDTMVSNQKSFILCGDFGLTNNADEPFVLILGSGLLADEAEDIEKEVHAFGYEEAYIWTP